MLVAFLVFVLCSFVFAADNAVLHVDNQPAKTVVQGDTVEIAAELDPGENFIEWTIVSGTATILIPTNQATKIIPKSADVVIQKKTQKTTIKFKELDEDFTNIYVYEEAFSVSNNLYGAGGKFTAPEAGQYAMQIKFKVSFQLPQQSTDSLFTTKSSVPYDKRYFVFNAEANQTKYFIFRHSSKADFRDTIHIRVFKSRTLTLSEQGPGAATQDSSGTPGKTYTNHQAGDSVAITATSNTDCKFIRWEKISGSCSIVNTQLNSTKAVMGESDCSIRAVFAQGTIYDITTTPTQYTVSKDLYSNTPSNKNNDVRFKLNPTTSGNYVVYVSSNLLKDSTKYSRFPNDAFSSSSKAKNFNGTYIDTVSITAGTPAYIAVTQQNGQSFNDPFWISYAPLSSATYSLKVSSGTQGSVTPSTPYTGIASGAKLVISAKANDDYRFQKWEVVSGNVTFDDASAPSTYVSITSNAEIRALYQKGSVHTLSFDEQTFNFQSHYYNESTMSSVRFTWTPPDTNAYIVIFNPIDSFIAMTASYGTDSTFQKPTLQASTSDRYTFLVKGNANEPQFWTYQAFSQSIPDLDFKANVDYAPILNITSNSNGSTHPNGENGVNYSTKTTITAWPYGGFTFNSWKINSGDCTIEDKNSSVTHVNMKDSSCAIQANFVIDISAQPSIKIDNIDLGNYPGICAQVSVTDQNNRSINGLTDKDFILFEDNTSLNTQISRINEVSAISTVFVIDQSGTMSNNNRIPKTKDALHNFISGMGPFDRAAIVGFSGRDSTTVHQAMTSDTTLLLKAVDGLTGGDRYSLTNIFKGTYTGIEQALNEINPTAIIVFSDGENNTDSKTMEEVLEAARAQDLSIYSIGLETTVEHPLKDLADSTSGTFTFAKDAAELAGIYASIRDNMQSKYMICYQTPDTLLNGDEHEIKINISRFGKDASATTTWQESFMPPTITLTPSTWDKIDNSQPAQTALPIQVYITTSSPVVTASINIRHTSRNNSTYNTYPLTNVHDSLWEYVLPADSAIAPGVDFYLTVIDSAGFLGKSPKITSPSREPYTIGIGNDLPRISLVSAECADSTKGSKTFIFRAADNDDVMKVSFFYREKGDVLFKETNLYHKSVADSTWFISVPSDATISDGLEFYARAYDTQGASVRWETTGYKETDACFIKEVFQDLPDTISIVSADSSSIITRSSESIKLIVKTEDFSEEKDTVIVNLRCLESGDMESYLPLLETTSGAYEAVFPKDEHLPKRDDGTISCTGNDTLVATYKDPAFGTFVFDTVVIANYVAITYQFLDTLQNEDLDSVETATHADFLLRVTTTSESIHKIDTVAVTLFTATGDTLIVTATETDTNSAIFDYIGKFYFVADSSELEKKKLDGIMLFDQDRSREKIQAQVLADSSALKDRDSLIVFTKYVPADSAEIYDNDLDGQADFVRIHFKKPLEKNIQSIDTLFWNVGHKNPYFVSKKALKMSSDKFWVEAVLDSAFEYGKTAASDSANLPYLRVTKTSTDPSQKVVFTDKVGAVPVKAFKRPGKLDVDEYIAEDIQIPPDTLLVTLSEKITRTGDKKEWNNVFRYSRSCTDTVTKPVKFKGTPKISEDGLTWIMVLDDYGLLVGNCIQTNPEAKYTDMFGNGLGRGNVEITGKDGTLYLYQIEPNPSVTGIGQKAKWIPPKGKKFENVPDTLSTIKFSVVSPFKANIYIYDHMGAFVNQLHQEFGYNGEMTEPIRGNSNKYEKTGYLYWDQRSETGRKVGTGVYIWNIIFTFDDGHKESVTLKSGIRRGSNEK